MRYFKQLEIMFGLHRNAHQSPNEMLQVLRKMHSHKQMLMNLNVVKCCKLNQRSPNIGATHETNSYKNNLENNDLS